METVSVYEKKIKCDQSRFPWFFKNMNGHDFFWLSNKDNLITDIRLHILTFIGDFLSQYSTKFFKIPTMSLNNYDIFDGRSSQMGNAMKLFLALVK